LKDDRKWQRSIRINGQWRICFVWTVNGPSAVEIVDYIKEIGMGKLQNIHPGEILLEEFLRPMEISQTKLAHSIGVPPRRIN
jgi:hypothetical protein